MTCEIIDLLIIEPSRALARLRTGLKLRLGKPQIAYELSSPRYRIGAHHLKPKALSLIA
jgi:hypothetical protein